MRRKVMEHQKRVLLKEGANGSSWSKLRLGGSFSDDELSCYGCLYTGVYMSCSHRLIYNRYM